MEFEKQTLRVADDFDLEKIAACGQCFRARRFDGDTWRFITGRHILYIRKAEGGMFSALCEPGAWEQVWNVYFDLHRNYRAIRERAITRGGLAAEAAIHGAGIRVLRQDPWEMLVSFLISQRKSIPAIAGAVDKLCRAFGEPLETGLETVCAFPGPSVLSAASTEELNACGLGYRTPYIQDAARRAASGKLDLRALSALDDEALFQELLQCKGAGKKVANCVCLYGFGRTARVPVDVWIGRALEDGSAALFDGFGDAAGIVQQYVFYYERGRRPRPPAPKSK